MSWGVALRNAVGLGLGGIPSLRNAPSLRATLDFNFLSGLLDPRITFSRTSNATLIGSDGTLQYAPHNLLTYSEQLDTSSFWAQNAVTVSSNVLAAPNGTVTADKIVETNAATSAFQIFQSPTLTSGLTYAFSSYIKAGERTWAFLRLGNAINLNAYFNLASGTVGIVDPGLTATIQAVGNGWYRCTVTHTVTAVTAAYAVAIGAAESDGVRIYNGDGTSGIYTWGAQLNVGALQPYYSTTVKNLLGYSQEFDNAAWTKSNSTITANVTAAPDGSVTADKLVEDTVNAAHFVQSANLTAQSGTAYTFSCYAKAAERSKFELLAFALTLTGRGFDLSNGTTFTNTAGLSEPTASSITPVGNGWYRCSITANGNGLLSSVRAYLNNGTTYAYTGDGTSGIYVWGAQFSDSASLDPYVYNPAAAPSNTAYYGPRFDYDPVTLAAKGILIEEQRTNSIRNNTRQGAVAGTPGTLPTNWFIGNLAGLSTQVVAIGTESGVSYIDLRIFGTSTTTNFILNFEPTTQIPALQNQSWTGSFFVTYVAGTLTNVQNFSTTITERDSAGALLSTSTALRNLTNTPLIQNRYVNSYTLPTATAAYVTLRLDVGVAATSAIDITLRIGLPQLELGAFATSVIPTTTAAATRAADVLSITGANFSSWYNQAEGTFYFEGSVIGSTGADQIGLNANNAAFTERVRLGRVSNTARFTVVDDGVVQADLTGGTWAVNAVKKLAGAYAVNSIALSVAGETPLVDTAATIPTPTQLQIGNEQLATYLNGHIRSFKYYPTRLSNGQLQTLTK